MSMVVTYIFRKTASNYKSIEELFKNVISEIQKHMTTNTFEVAYSGGTPRALLKNILSLRGQSEVYHITGDVHYMALALKKHTVLTIHDVNSALYGGVLKNLYVKLFWFWLPALCVKRITVISNFTKLELSKIIPFAKHKIRVIPNPVSKTLKPTAFNFDAGNPHVLLVGTKSNKNIERSIAALKDIPCTVAIIGKLSAAQQQLLLVNTIDFENFFNLSYEAITEQYKRAHLVCFPSIYEGFGMPIVEAQAIGRPVLTSNIGAMVEVAGEGAYLVNPFEVASIRNGILQILNSESLRTELIQKGFENVTRFQTQHIATQYIALYDEIIKS